MENINWNEVEVAQEFEKVVPGGYIIGITSVEDVPDKQYLSMEYDIAEGKLKNYYKKLFESKGFWGAKFIRSYKEKARPFFKGFLTAVEKSNNGFKFDNDETKLKRKLLGVVLGEEEYEANDGTIKTRFYVAECRNADSIRKGDFKVPELKKLPFTTSSNNNTKLDEMLDDGDMDF